MPSSSYLADKQLNWFRNQAFGTPISNLFISVHSGDPGANGTGNDATTTIGSGRATLSSSNISAPAAATGGGRQVSNTATVTMTGSSTNNSPVTITHFGAWDSVTGGNFLAYGLVSPPVTVLLGDTVSFPVGNLIIKAV